MTGICNIPSKSRRKQKRFGILSNLALLAETIFGIVFVWRGIDV